MDRLNESIIELLLKSERITQYGLSKQFGVSRTRIGKAIEKLKNEKIISDSGMCLNPALAFLILKTDGNSGEITALSLDGALFMKSYIPFVSAFSQEENLELLLRKLSSYRTFIPKEYTRIFTVAVCFGKTKEKLVRVIASHGENFSEIISDAELYSSAHSTEEKISLYINPKRSISLITFENREIGYSTLGKKDIEEALFGFLQILPAESVVLDISDFEVGVEEKELARLEKRLAHICGSLSIPLEIRCPATLPTSASQISYTDLLIIRKVLSA